MKDLVFQGILLLMLTYSGLGEESRIPSLTAEQWRQDLHSFVQQIQTHHRDGYHLSSKEKFDAAVASLDKSIPSMKDYQVVVALQGLAAMIGDGHTFLDTSKLYHRFPLQVFWFGGDLRVVRAAPEYKRALGAKVVRIGSSSVQEVQNRLQQLIPAGENRWYVLDKSADLIVELEPLLALHVLSTFGPADVTFDDDSGHQFVLRIAPQSEVEASSLLPMSDPPPLPFQHSDDPLWFTYLADSETVYVDFRSYANLEESARRLWDFVGQHRVNRLVIDMRWNGGGDYTKGRQYLIYKTVYMQNLNRPGHLFVITGRKTFSAAMTNVTDFRRETEVILVGEPTGARPNGYQENYWFTLPISHLRVSCALLKYRFQPHQDTDAVFPDKRIDPDWDAFRSGGDAALKWIQQQK